MHTHSQKHAHKENTMIWAIEMQKYKLNNKTK